VCKAAVILLRHTHTKVLSHSTAGSVLFPALQLFSWDLSVACGRQKVSKWSPTMLLERVTSIREVHTSLPGGAEKLKD
jgi:hypothetical protein